jgi:hypothetical protein
MCAVDETLRPEPESWVRWATHKETLDELQQCRVALAAVAEIIESDDPDYDEVMEIIERAVADGDPTPWCSGCGAMRKSDCHCGPMAENE